MTSETRAHQFFNAHVLPSMRDWEANLLEEHRAMNLAVNLNQMADHYWHSFHNLDPAKVLNAKDVNAFRKALCAMSPEFSLVRDVADAHKHMKLSRSDRHLSSAGQTTIAFLGWGEAKWGEAKWGSPSEIVVTYDDGSTHHFSNAVH